MANSAPKSFFVLEAFSVEWSDVKGSRFCVFVVDMDNA